MTDIQASIGLQQLRRLAGFHRRRREIAEMYRKAFSPIQALNVPIEREEVEHSWHLYVLRLRPDVLSIPRNRFIEELKLRNIGCSVHFIPIHVHPYYRNKYGWVPTDFPVAYENFNNMLSLPLNPRLTDSDVADVIEAVMDIVRRFQR